MDIMGVLQRFGDFSAQSQDTTAEFQFLPKQAQKGLQIRPPGKCIKLNHPGVCITIEDQTRKAIVFTIQDPVAGRARCRQPVPQNQGGF